MNAHLTFAPSRRNATGLTLVELLVAMALGLVLTVAVATMYLSSKSGMRRQTQLSAVQQSVRTAFDYLARDARMVGHLGCFTGRMAAGGFNSNLAATAIETNYAVGVEGFDYTTTGNAYTLGSNAPTDVTSGWVANTSSNGVNAIPVPTLAGSTTGGLTPGSDVLVIHTVSGGPVRLTASTAAGGSTISVENISGGTCSDGSTPKASGFCTNSHGLIANCTQARVFSVASVAGSTTLTINGTLDATPYAGAATEVFPMQTVAYYVKRSSSGTSTSLYRRIFDGDNAGGLEQELIEGVEMLQVRYGIDSTLPVPDGVIDSYTTATGVTDWTQVIAVRMSLLLRPQDTVAKDAAVPTTGVVNGVTVTYPTTGGLYDRRVFTTTVAVRNRISYF